MRSAPWLAIGLAFAAPSSAQNVANGEILYFQYCNECHGFPPAGGPQNAGDNPGMIRGAIEIRVSRMRILSFLTDTQLADIAAFIGRAVRGDPAPALDYTGLWLDAAEPGWGLSVAQHRASGDTVFALVFTYEAPNRPMWFSMPSGRWTTPTTYSGSLYRTSGPQPAQPFDTSRVDVREVGTLTLAFESANAATLTYSVDGAAFTRRITRFAF